jgi:hypothetical protein
VKLRRPESRETVMGGFFKVGDRVEATTELKASWDGSNEECGNSRREAFGCQSK